MHDNSSQYLGEVNMWDEHVGRKPQNTHIGNCCEDDKGFCAPGAQPEKLKKLIFEVSEAKKHTWG